MACMQCCHRAGIIQLQDRLRMLPVVKGQKLKPQQPQGRCFGWQVVEELMSIADGQVVLERDRGDAGASVGVDARLSVSRIGSRAYPPALATLAPSIRLELAQARP